MACANRVVSAEAQPARPQTARVVSIMALQTIGARSGLYAKCPARMQAGRIAWICLSIDTMAFSRSKLVELDGAGGLQGRGTISADISLTMPENGCT
jgi:hypothetical protein